MSRFVKCSLAYYQDPDYSYDEDNPGAPNVAVNLDRVATDAGHAQGPGPAPVQGRVAGH